MTLQSLLRANGAFSATSGAVLVLGAAALDTSLGLNAWLLFASGVGLVGYGAVLFAAARDDAIGGGRFATAADLAWVVGATILLVGFPSVLTGAGRLALLLVTIVVGGFAVGQALALRREASLS